MTFDEWFDKEGEGTEKVAPVYKFRRAWTQMGWDAALKYGVQQEEPEPTSTEMVKRLLEKGWKIDQDYLNYLTLFDPDGYGYETIVEAYRKALPKKVKKEIDAWYYPNTGAMINHTPTPDSCCNPEGWIKGTATFYVDEE